MLNIQATGLIYGETITVKQINKLTAKKLYNNGETIYMQTSNFAPFGVWQNLMTANVKEDIDNTVNQFEYLCDSFRWYNCDNERGKYIHFYQRIK